MAEGIDSPKRLNKAVNPSGKLPDNILYFARTLRGAGMRLGPASVVDAVRAVEVAGITDREDFYWILHTIFVKRREDHPVFDEAFKLYWRSRELVEKMLQMFSPMAANRDKQAEKKAGQSRVSQALFAGQENQKPKEKPQIEIDALLSASGNEVLRKKDFAQMNVEELAEAKLAMGKMVMPIKPVKTRRFESVNRARLFDPRRTLSRSLRKGGDLILPQYRQRKNLLPPIVVLADISGSMANYSRIFLHFLHALSESQQKVHAFLFGTRLTNITRQLRKKDVDEAIADCSSAVDDWSGGTRIGSTFSAFNKKWSRRVLGQGAIVLLITDGLERDKDDLLEKEMSRLQLSCRRLIWLNPLLRFDGFEARARGIRAMLPYVDEFRPVHSLDAMADLCVALSKPMHSHNDPKKWLDAISPAD